MREPELQGPHRAVAEAAVDALDDHGPRRVELVAPTVILHQDVQRSSGEHRRLRTCCDLRTYRVGPHRRRNMAVEAPAEPVAVQRAAQDAAHHFTASAGKEVRSAHARVRKRTS